MGGRQRSVDRAQHSVTQKVPDPHVVAGVLRMAQPLHGTVRGASCETTDAAVASSPYGYPTPVRPPAGFVVLTVRPLLSRPPAAVRPLMGTSPGPGETVGARAGACVPLSGALSAVTGGLPPLVAWDPDPDRRVDT